MPIKLENFAGDECLDFTAIELQKECAIRSNRFEAAFPDDAVIVKADPISGLVDDSLFVCFEEGLEAFL